jgi:hypothetical protein
MMKKLISVTAYMLLVSGVVLLSGCSEDEPSPVGTVNLSVSSSGSNSFSTARIMGRSKADIVITDFQISIRDVIFKSDVDDEGVSDDSTEVAFRGPYQVDLLNGSDALTETIGSAEIPNGIYEEVRFKFHKDEDLSTDQPLYDKSIFISGTIDGMPFEMWHDTSENLDLGKNSGGIVVDDNVVNLTVDFTIDQFMSSLVQIDLSDAVDGNQDGMIDINPNDSDGNKEIADDLKENIKAAADLLDGE